MKRNEFEKRVAAYAEDLLSEELTHQMESRRAADIECDKLARFHKLVIDTLDSVEAVEVPVGFSQRILAAAGKLEEDYLEEVALRKRALKISFGLCFSVIAGGFVLTVIFLQGGALSSSSGYVYSLWQAVTSSPAVFADMGRQVLEYLTQPLPVGSQLFVLTVAFIFTFTVSLLAGIAIWLTGRDENAHRLPILYQLKSQNLF